MQQERAPLLYLLAWLIADFEYVRFVHVLYVRYTVTVSMPQCTKTGIARSRERKRTSHAVQCEALEGCGRKGDADRVREPSHRGAYRPREGEGSWDMGRVNRFVSSCFQKQARGGHGSVV